MTSEFYFVILLDLAKLWLKFELLWLYLVWGNLSCKMQAWERDLAEDLDRPVWERENGSDDDYESEDGEESAAKHLLDYLLQKLHRGELYARTVSTICYWAGKAGARGVSHFGKQPSTPSGHFRRHIDKQLQVRRSKHYKVPIPCFSKPTFQRYIRDVPVAVPHEVLDEEAANDPCFADTLSNAELPELYHQRVRQFDKGRPVSPVALYLDGVPFNKRDSCLGIWTYHVLTGRRHLCLVLRKSWLCRCGCKGWCSLWAAFEFCRWSFAHGANGEYPNAGFRNEPLKHERATLAGKQLAFRQLLLYIKGDWAEIAHHIGLPSWSTNLNPCPTCMTTREEWLDFDDVEDDVDANLPWPPLTGDDLSGKNGKMDLIFFWPCHSLFF